MSIGMALLQETGRPIREWSFRVKRRAFGQFRLSECNERVSSSLATDVVPLFLLPRGMARCVQTSGQERKIGRKGKPKAVVVFAPRRPRMRLRVIGSCSGA